LAYSLPEQKMQPSLTGYVGGFGHYKAWYVFL